MGRYFFLRYFFDIADVDVAKIGHVGLRSTHVELVAVYAVEASTIECLPDSADARKEINEG